MTESVRSEITRDAIAETYALISPHVRRTPIIDILLPEAGASREPVCLKLEMLQYAGSFKTRGAFTNLLTREIPPVGVAAASGGNHGAAVAYAAMKLGVRARIFVPTISSPAKLRRIRSYGAMLEITGERFADAYAASLQYIGQTGALDVHAFDQRETILGQATLAYEFAQQAPDLDTMLVAIGGGGLIGGIAAWYRGSVRVVGVEPEGAPTMTAALAAGRPADAATGSVAADSLAPRRIGELVYPIAKEYVDHVVLVSDEAIREAQEHLWETARIVTEAGGAAAFSALLSGRYRPQAGEKVGVVLSGGNTVAVNF